MRRYALLLLLLAAVPASGGGGLVLRNDTCIMTIGFYEAHFTAYQPQTGGDREYCENLPAAGETVVVLDYLHRSLKEVPVTFRIIENITGKGEFARLADVEAIADIDAHTVFYLPPVVQRDARLLVEHTFANEGNFIGIVTAGHPSNDKVYTSVFPFRVGRSELPWGWLALALAVLVAGGFLLTIRRIGGRQAESGA